MLLITHSVEEALFLGTRVAVPRALPYFGEQRLPDHEVKLLAYLIGDGGLTGTSAMFTTASEPIRAEVEAAAGECGVELRFVQRSGRASDYRLTAGRGRANGVLELLRRHGAMGLGAHAKHVPAAIFTTVSTTGSQIENCRVSAFWNARTISQATGTGSWARSGADPCPPTPRTSTNSSSAAAISGPGRPNQTPRGWSAE